MIRNSLRRALIGIAFAGGALIASSPASAFSYANGDLVAAFVKGGYELILNLGPAPTGPSGASIDVTTLSVPSTGFGGSLDGATLTAFSVRDPNRFFTTPGLETVNQANIILTTNGNAGSIDFNSVNNAQAQLQGPGIGSTWLKNLTTVPAANGTTILENSLSRIVFQDGQPNTSFATYTDVLGLGSNAIANTVPVSTITTVSPTVIGTSIPLYEVIQTAVINPASGDYDLGSQATRLGSLNLVPEPGTALLLGAGLIGLLRFGSRRDA